MFHYYMFYKPFGCVTARRDPRYPTVMDYFRECGHENLSPAGRLDRQTEGLLFITDDGKWNQLMTHPDHHKEKTYEFTALGMLDAEKIKSLESGVYLKGSSVLTAPCHFQATGACVLSQILPSLHPEIQEATNHDRPDHPVVTGRITITEGRKHQIRRMMKTAGCCVIGLKRISIDGITLDKSLKPGEWKAFTPNLGE